MNTPSVQLAIPTAYLAPPDPWVARTEDVFPKIGRWALLFRLGSAPWSEVDGGIVQFHEGSHVDGDGSPGVSCSAPGLSADRLSARELVTRIHARAWDYFAGATTASGDPAKTADVAMVLFSPADKQLVRVSRRIARRAADAMVDDDDRDAVSKVVAGSQILGDTTTRLAQALVSSTAVRERGDTAREGLLHQQLESVGKGYQQAFEMMRGASLDAMVAADVRARAEKDAEINALKSEQRAWYDSALAEQLVGGLLPVGIKLLGELTQTMAIKLQVRQVRAGAELEAAKREAAASSSATSSPPTPSSAKPTPPEKVERETPEQRAERLSRLQDP